MKPTNKFPDMIKVKCPKCGREWDYIFQKEDGPPELEVKCSLCAYNEYLEKKEKS